MAVISSVRNLPFPPFANCRNKQPLSDISNDMQIPNAFPDTKFA
jgi:hypothetical protein